MWRHVLLAIALGNAPVCADAGTIAGQVQSQATMAGIAGVEVRVFGLTAKGWRVVATMPSNGSGFYSIVVPAGDYLVQATPANITTQCLLMQRYYDEVAPSAAGTREDAADVITLPSAGSSITGINIAIPAAGAIDGRVMHGGVGIDGLRVRVESRPDPRIHVETTTSSIGAVPGSFSACGIAPGLYRIWLHDPAARFEDLVMPGPFTVLGGARQVLGAFTATPMGDDPNEPNPSTDIATPVPAPPWASSGAVISPVAEDIDVYCLDAVAGDRHVITTSTRVLVAGEERSHPWIDPMLGWFSAASGRLLATNDDTPELPASLDARLETPSVATDGRYCVAVTMFGDSDFNGSGQISAGRYALRIGSVVLFADGFE
jgi:hypothetical protein